MSVQTLASLEPQPNSVPSSRDEGHPRGGGRRLQTAADGDLEWRVALFLSQRGLLCKRDFQVQAVGGIVTVQGRLPSPQARHFCLECCRHVAGVIKLIDQLKVESSGISDEVSSDRPVDQQPEAHHALT